MPRDGIKTERVWTHKGVWCAVVGADLGHRCGYVRVPDNHPDRHTISEDRLAYWRDMAKPKTYPEPFTDMSQFWQEPERQEAAALADEWGDKISAHGGITFAREFTKQQQIDDWLGGDGAPSGLWIGFDCAHYNDLKDHDLIIELTAPGSKEREIYLESARAMDSVAWRSGADKGVLWTTDMVVKECEFMAEQLIGEDDEQGRSQADQGVHWPASE